MMPLISESSMRRRDEKRGEMWHEVGGSIKKAFILIIIRQVTEDESNQHT